MRKQQFPFTLAFVGVAGSGGTVQTMRIPFVDARVRVHLAIYQDNPIRTPPSTMAGFLVRVSTGVVDPASGRFAPLTDLIGNSTAKEPLQTTGLKGLSLDIASGEGEISVELDMSDATGVADGDLLRALVTYVSVEDIPCDEWELIKAEMQPSLGRSIPTIEVP